MEESVAREAWIFGGDGLLRTFLGALSGGREHQGGCARAGGPSRARPTRRRIRVSGGGSGYQLGRWSNAKAGMGGSSGRHDDALVRQRAPGRGRTVGGRSSAAAARARRGQRPQCAPSHRRRSRRRVPIAPSPARHRAVAGPGARTRATAAGTPPPLAALDRRPVRADRLSQDAGAHRQPTRPHHLGAAGKRRRLRREAFSNNRSGSVIEASRSTTRLRERRVR